MVLKENKQMQAARICACKKNETSCKVFCLFLSEKYILMSLIFICEIDCKGLIQQIVYKMILIKGRINAQKMLSFVNKLKHTKTLLIHSNIHLCKLRFFLSFAVRLRGATFGFQ